MKYKILITDPISESGISILKDNNCEIIDKTESKDSIHEIIDKIDGWIIRSGTKISETDIKAAENLQVIGRAGVGVDNIDIKTITTAAMYSAMFALGLSFFNTPLTFLCFLFILLLN